MGLSSPKGDTASRSGAISKGIAGGMREHALRLTFFAKRVAHHSIDSASNTGPSTQVRL